MGSSHEINAIQLGNQTSIHAAVEPLVAQLKDSIPIVRIAAARAISKLTAKKSGISTLEDALQHPDEWVRLAGTQVLDELGEGARVAIPALEAVMQDQNKYVVRVANHALNLLLETESSNAEGETIEESSKEATKKVVPVLFDLGEEDMAEEPSKGKKGNSKTPEA